MYLNLLDLTNITIMYKEKRYEPRIKPWVIPHTGGADDDDTQLLI